MDPGTCTYCGKSYEGLPYYSKRVTCGGVECKLAYMRNYKTQVRMRTEGVAGPTRTWGSFVIPSTQDKLNGAMLGQVMHCANCGDAMVVQADQHQKCQKCGALWTVSWGIKENGDVAVARLDRWS